MDTLLVLSSNRIAHCMTIISRLSLNLKTAEIIYIYIYMFSIGKTFSQESVEHPNSETNTHPANWEKPRCACRQGTMGTQGWVDCPLCAAEKNDWFLPKLKNIQSGYLYWSCTLVLRHKHLVVIGFLSSQKSMLQWEKTPTKEQKNRVILETRLRSSPGFSLPLLPKKTGCVTWSSIPAHHSTLDSKHLNSRMVQGINTSPDMMGTLVVL